ncbi:unnamed protein product [Clonostachys rhizophaga]|uniref:HAM1-like N-terminal domain-containing protein n=1 Tax=Clonostachys rhizophaga TaxID=160324 RepID=A0A9N9UZB2_9HYPO|nr:unnamed protein product [Clonostachys rhizophaga]
MFSCACFGSRERRDPEREPLLPVYNDDTAMQARLHEKLHTYQMLRAMSKGYMPSNEQTIIHLRTLLAADVLNPDVPELSNSGRALVRTTKLLLRQVIELLDSKNSGDQVQDFIWCLVKSRLHVDTGDIAARAGRVSARSDAMTAYHSLQTIGSLLLNSSEFRLFLSDLGTIGREVFSDTALSLAEVSKQTAKKLEPSVEDQKSLEAANGHTDQAPPTKQDLTEEVKDVAHVITEGASSVAQGAKESVAEHLSGEEEQALATRLKNVILKLRKKPDYSESVNMVSLLMRHYLLAYSHAAEDAAQAIGDDFSVNKEADKAVRNFWLLLTSLGDRNEWREVEGAFNRLVEGCEADPNLDEFIKELSVAVENILSNPDWLDNVDSEVKELREKSNKIRNRSSISEDVKLLFAHLRLAMQSVADDEQVRNILRTSTRLANILSPAGKKSNGELIADAINVFLPMTINAIQYIPIPRLEVATPAVDLLLENLILEPGKTVNHSSFLPFRFNVSTQNDIEVRKARFRTTSSMTSLVTLKISGMSIAAEDLGYWVKLHSWCLRFMDQGLAGFYLDERGIDLTLDLEIGKDRMEKIVSLRNVNVKIHHLDYTLGKSPFSCLAWVFKPLLRPVIRKALEIKMATAIAEGLHTLNRELLFARERLRATRIANPGDLWTFVRAVAARLIPAPDPDFETRVGITPGGGVFRGRYAPGSLVKLWEQEGRDAEQLVYEYQRGGWRNKIFDVRTMTMETPP